MRVHTATHAAGPEEMRDSAMRDREREMARRRRVREREMAAVRVHRLVEFVDGDAQLAPRSVLVEALVYNYIYLVRACVFVCTCLGVVL